MGKRDVKKFHSCNKYVLKAQEVPGPLPGKKTPVNKTEGHLYPHGVYMG